jgi:hypothetical protein
LFKSGAISDEASGVQLMAVRRIYDIHQHLENHEKQNGKASCIPTKIKTVGIRSLEKNKAILKRLLQDGSNRPYYEKLNK